MQIKKLRGLALASPETRKRVASMGGRKVSQDKAFMSMIGKKGGTAISRDKGHMSMIGKLGGVATREAPHA